MFNRSQKERKHGTSKTFIMKRIYFALVTKSSNQTIDKLFPVHLRIKLDGQTRFISTREKVSLKPTVKENGRMVSVWEKTKHFKDVRDGSDEQTQRKRMDMFIDRAKEYFDEKVNKNELVTVDMIIDHLNGKAEIEKKLQLVKEQMTFFQCYNKYKAQFDMLVKGGKRVAETFNKFNSMKLQLVAYLKEETGNEDINLSLIEKPFLPNFYKYLLSKIGCETANNYIKAFKLIIDFAVEQDYLKHYPFAKLKREHDKKLVETNTPDEFQKLLTTEINDPYIDEARDIYNFSCTTGFSYIDLYKLEPEHLEKLGFDKFRQKTDIKALPILTDIAKKILAKYKNHPKCLERGTLLPVPDNSTLNARLKMVGALCQIKTRLNIHKARHYFGETLKNSDIKDNIHQAMMGHKEGSRQTARYGKTRKETVRAKAREIQGLFKIAS